MKKGAVYTLVTIFVLGLVAVGVLQGWNYYQGRYVGSTYYALVPDDADITLDNLVDNRGNVVDTGHEYDLIAVNEAGETKDINFTLPADKQEDLYQPGTYLKVKASKQLVVKQEPVDSTEVPANVLTQLDNQNQ